jgi:hypothetical protein
MPVFHENICSTIDLGTRIGGVAWSVQRILTAVNLGFLEPEPLLFHSSSSSDILTEVGWTPFETISKKIW